MTSTITALGLDFGFTLVEPVLAPVDCLVEAAPESGVSRGEVVRAQPDEAGVRAALAAAHDVADWDRTVTGWYRAWAVAAGIQVLAGDMAAERYQQASNWRPRPGAAFLLRQCAAGGLPVGILSTWGAGLPELVNALGWRDLVDTVIASSSTGVAKPAKAAFDQLSSQLGERPGDILFVGDDPVADYDGAVAAGLRAVLIADERVADGRPVVSSLYALAAMVV